MGERNVRNQRVAVDHWRVSPVYVRRLTLVRVPVLRISILPKSTLSDSCGQMLLAVSRAYKALEGLSAVAIPL